MKNNHKEANYNQIETRDQRHKTTKRLKTTMVCQNITTKRHNMIRKKHRMADGDTNEHEAPCGEAVL